MVTVMPAPGGGQPHQPVRVAALQWVCRALAAELGDSVSPAELRERAEQLMAITEQYGLPVEELITWIHLKPPDGGRIWSAVEWRACCERIAPLWNEMKNAAAAESAAKDDKTVNG